MLVALKQRSLAHYNRFPFLVRNIEENQIAVETLVWHLSDVYVFEQGSH